MLAVINPLSAAVQAQKRIWRLGLNNSAVQPLIALHSLWSHVHMLPKTHASSLQWTKEDRCASINPILI